MFRTALPHSSHATMIPTVALRHQTGYRDSGRLPARVVGAMERMAMAVCASTAAHRRLVVHTIILSLSAFVAAPAIGA